MGELLGVESGGKIRSFTFRLALLITFCQLSSVPRCLSDFFFFFKQTHEVGRVTHNPLR